MSKVSFANAVAVLVLAMAPLSASAAQRHAKHHGMHRMMVMVNGRMAPVFVMMNGQMMPVYVGPDSANGS